VTSLHLVWVACLDGDRFLTSTRTIYGALTVYHGLLLYIAVYINDFFGAFFLEAAHLGGLALPWGFTNIIPSARSQR
jgi:hypothetical protein